jgi:hypothetical protein
MTSSHAKTDAVSADDPLSFTVARLHWENADKILSDNIGLMREHYGDEVADTLRSAYAESDLQKAGEFAALLLPGFTFEVVRDDEKVVVEFTADGDLDGMISLYRRHQRAGDPVVNAVLKVATRAYADECFRKQIEAEEANEEAAARLG